jgi:hypothetical protein
MLTSAQNSLVFSTCFPAHEISGDDPFGTLIVASQPLPGQRRCSSSRCPHSPRAGPQRARLWRPAETWQTAQRLSALGYDWHNIMHMIAAVVSDDLYRAVQEHRQFDPGYRGRGISHSLLGGAVAYAQSQGAPAISAASSAPSSQQASRSCLPGVPVMQAGGRTARHCRPVVIDSTARAAPPVSVLPCTYRA